MNAGKLVGVLICGLACVLGGCVGWANYPPEEGQTRFISPNEPGMTDIMAAGLKYVANKYPPEGLTRARAAATGLEPSTQKFAVNLPEGVRPRLSQRIVQLAGERAVLLTPETEHLPIYHIASLRVRGDEGQVNILRPVPEFGVSPTGEPVYQEITVTLRGGVQPWRVVSHREWSPGSVASIPPLRYYHPDRPTAAADTDAK